MSIQYFNGEGEPTKVAGGGNTFVRKSDYDAALATAAHWKEKAEQLQGRVDDADAILRDCMEPVKLIAIGGRRTSADLEKAEWTLDRLRSWRKRPAVSAPAVACPICKKELDDDSCLHSPDEQWAADSASLEQDDDHS